MHDTMKVAVTAALALLLDSTSSVLRWGILSAGKISSDFCQALQLSHGAEPAAVAAKDVARARVFAQRHGLHRYYGTYEELVQDPTIDVIYIGSIADQHAALTRLCLEHAKPVVVEKPLALSFRDAQELVALSRSTGTFLMEGLWTRCFPATLHVQTLLRQGVIGRPIVVQGDFGWKTEACGPDERIWFPDSGGMTMDRPCHVPSHLGASGVWKKRTTGFGARDWDGATGCGSLGGRDVSVSVS